jgi:hypothetical protein
VTRRRAACLLAVAFGLFVGLLISRSARGHLERAAIEQCPNRYARDVPRDVLVELWRIDRSGLPEAARGLVLAAACNESGYRASGKCGDAGRSCGMFQLMKWTIPGLRAIGAKGADPRLDWRAAARFYVSRVVRQIPRVRRHCRGRRGYATRESMLWASAVQTAVRAPKCAERNTAGRCVRRVPRCARRGSRYEAKHWARLRQWRQWVQR